MTEKKARADIEDLERLEALASGHPPTPFEEAFSLIANGTSREYAKDFYDEVVQYYNPGYKFNIKLPKAPPGMTPEEYVEQAYGYPGYAHQSESNDAETGRTPRPVEAQPAKIDPGENPVLHMVG